MNYLMSFDGGASTGIVLGEYGTNSPYRIISAWQVEGGVAGLLGWCRDRHMPAHSAAGFPAGWWFGGDVISSRDMEYVSERFVPLSGRGFNQTSASVEPLRVEGALIALGLLPPEYTSKQWQRASCQVLMGGDTPAQRKKNTDQLLRDKGYWHTGKQVGAKDANDVNSATKHALYYVTRILKHKPTLSLLYPE